MSQRKIAMVVGYGQSNEAGTGTAPRYSGLIAAHDPNNYVRHTPLYSNSPNPFYVTGTPGNSTACSIFQKLAEVIALRKGWKVALENKAIGGSAAVDNWAGYASAVKRPGDAGYDPNSYIANTVASVAAWVARGYEVWTFTAGHQSDLAASRSVSDIVTANTDIQAALIAAGASKVFVGKTPRYVGGAYEAEFDAGGKIHQIAANTIAGIGSKAFAGGDLSANTDLSKVVAGGGLNNIHINHAGVCWAAGVWRDALIAGGHI